MKSWNPVAIFKQHAPRASGAVDAVDKESLDESRLNADTFDQYLLLIALWYGRRPFRHVMDDCYGAVKDISNHLSLNILFVSISYIIIAEAWLSEWPGQPAILRGIRINV